MKIVIGGDLSVMEDCQKVFESADYKTAFTDVMEVMKASDYTIVNLECPITESTNEIKKFGPCLKSPIGTAEALKA